MKKLLSGLAIATILINFLSACTGLAESVTEAIGMLKANITMDMTEAFKDRDISAEIDPGDGSITLGAYELFDIGTSNLSENGRLILNKCLPAFMGVLVDNCRDCIGEIRIEVHSDTTGTYTENLEMTQNRAMSVLVYAISGTPISDYSMLAYLKSRAMAYGRSYSNTIMNEDGTENQEASNRVIISYKLINEPTEGLPHTLPDFYSPKIAEQKESEQDRNKPEGKESDIERINALRRAREYLEYTAFSRNGLIKQLEFDGYSHAAAEYAVENCGANWEAQAVRKAQQYLNYSAFSRSQLISQLEYEGFTHAQAEHGAAENGY